MTLISMSPYREACVEFQVPMKEFLSCKSQGIKECSIEETAILSRNVQPEEANLHLNMCIPSKVICSNYFMFLKIKPLPEEKKKKVSFVYVLKTELTPLPPDTIIISCKNLKSCFNISLILKKSLLVTDRYWTIERLQNVICFLITEWWLWVNGWELIHMTDVFFSINSA